MARRVRPAVRVVALAAIVVLSWVSWDLLGIWSTIGGCVLILAIGLAGRRMAARHVREKRVRVARLPRQVSS